jgi:hypothetical protein
MIFLLRYKIVELINQIAKIDKVVMSSSEGERVIGRS